MNKMPIHPNDLKKTKLTSVPFALMRPGMARSNHGQTLERLAERGGMGVLEILDNIHERRLQFREATAEEIKELEKLVDDFSKPTMNKLQQAAIDHASDKDSHVHASIAKSSFLAGVAYAEGAFAEWCSKNKWVYMDIPQKWRSDAGEWKTTAELFKLWQEQSL